MARDHHIGLLGIDHVGIEAEAAALGTGAIDSQVIHQRTRYQILAPSDEIAPAHARFSLARSDARWASTSSSVSQSWYSRETSLRSAANSMPRSRARSTISARSF